VKITATIQARMGSTRLPGKALKPILGKPALALQVERIRMSRLIDEIVLATPDSPQNDVLEALAQDAGIQCFRGDEDDVLGRVVGALAKFDVDVHVEFQGDNAVPDPLLIDAIIGYYLKHRKEYDYVTNALETTYPPGTEVSVYPARVLIDAERMATDAALREHVGVHIYHRPDRYRVCNLEAPPWLHRPDLHLEIDTDEDFEVVRTVYEHFYPVNPGFSLAQVIEFADRTGLAELNKAVPRRWREFRRDGNA
jgi:spore coat polysaccharide biosynthesis protein SpsF